MRQEFRKDLHHINDEITALIDDSQVALKSAVEALLLQDKVKAQTVRKQMKSYLARLVTLEERVYEIILTQTPRARDLRFVQTALYTIYHLERSASNIDSIAKTAKHLRKVVIPSSLSELIMAEVNLVLRVRGEMRRAWAERDILAARSLPELDEPVDSLYKQFFRESELLSDSDDVATYTNLIMVSRNLERIADHAVNIGERLVFLMTGDRISLESLSEVSEDKIEEMVDEATVKNYRESDRRDDASASKQEAKTDDSQGD